jgi:predicted HTH transcriptional regulator
LTSEGKVTIQLRYRDIEKTFSGDTNDVWISINKFFSQFIPTFEISKKLVLTVDLQNLTKMCENIIAFAEDGPHLLVSRNRLTDNETLALQLLARYIGCKLGVIESDAVSKEELQPKLGKSSKIVSTRLGELVKREIAAKTNDGKYKISTFGIIQIQNGILPRIKAKIGS